MISRILFQISSDKHQRSLLSSSRVSKLLLATCFGKGKIVTSYISCTFTFKFEVVCILFLVREFEKHLKRHAHFVMRRCRCSQRMSRDSLKLSTFSSSLFRVRTRNVYRYKTFKFFIACRDFRAFLFENV